VLLGGQRRSLADAWLAGSKPCGLIASIKETTIALRQGNRETTLSPLGGFSLDFVFASVSCLAAAAALVARSWRSLGT